MMIILYTQGGAHNVMVIVRIYCANIFGKGINLANSTHLQATILFVDITKAFNSIHRRKMDQILLAYCLLKETVAAIMMLYRNTKVNARSPNGDVDYFYVVAGVR